MKKLYIVVVNTHYHGLAVEMITTDLQQAEEKVSYYEGEAEMYEFDEDDKGFTIISEGEELIKVESRLAEIKPIPKLEIKPIPKLKEIHGDTVVKHFDYFQYKTPKDAKNVE